MDIVQQLKGSVRIEEVVARLGLPLPTRTTEGRLGSCPTGHPSKSGKCFGVNLKDNYFNCFSCDESGDIINLVELVKSCDFKTALEWLVQEFRPDLKSQLTASTNQQKHEDKTDYLKAELFNHIHEYGKDLLFTPIAEAERNYLIQKRGFCPDTLKQTDWIYFPPEKEVKQHLLQQFPDAEKAIAELKLQGFAGDRFRLAFPYRDRNGLITNFIKRSIESEGVSITKPDGSIVDNIRYDSTPGTGTKHDLFNLCNCRGKDTLIIVEGYPDALKFPTLGIDNIVAVGQGKLAKSHLEGLKEFKVKNVIIAFDNDPPKIHHKTGKEYITGVENTDKAIETLEGTGIKAFVIPPLKLEPYKDPDEFVQGKGVSGFKELVKNAISSTKWQAHRLFEQQDTRTDLGRGIALQEAFKASLKLGNIDREQYLHIVGERLGITKEYMDEEFTRIHEESERERQLKEYQDYFNKGIHLASNGDVTELQNLLDQQKKFSLISTIPVIAPYSVEEFLEDIVTSPEGLKTGFKNLDDKLVIPNDAMTIIAGRPSHGKTTLMLNMCLNMVELYPDKSFLFFTYEEPRKHLTLKLLNILSGTVLEESNNQKILHRYLKGDHNNNTGVESGKEKLDKYFAEGRLWLVDRRLSAIELHQSLKDFSEEHDIGAVFIDYIQKIPSGAQFGTRQLELQNTSGAILEAATSLHIPIILGAQLNRERNLKDPGRVRLENLREAGDIEQDANLVIALYNEAMEALLSGEDALTTDCVDLSIQVLKNRNGIPMLQEHLQFQRSTLKISNPQLVIDHPSHLALL